MSNRAYFENLHPTQVDDQELRNRGPKGKSEIILMSWNATGSRLVNSRTDKSMRVWRCIRDEFSDPSILQETHSRSVESVSWSPINEYSFASCGRDSTVKLWDTTGPAKLIKEIKVNRCNDIVAYSPDGHYLAVVDKDTTVTILDVRDGFQQLASIKIHEHVYGFTWANTSDFFLLALHDGTVPIYKFTPETAQEETGAFSLIHSLKAHRSSATCVKMDPRGTFIVVGSNEGVISLWKTSKLICEKVITHVDEAISKIDLSRDGTYMVVSYDNNSNSRVFDCETLNQLLEVRNSKAGDLTIPQAAFSPAKTALIHTANGGRNMVYLHKKDGKK